MEPLPQESALAMEGGSILMYSGRVYFSFTNGSSM
jgi:hypothetical protein